MPQGCDFICVNNDCEHVGMSVSMHGLWPLQSIDRAIEKANLELDTISSSALVKRKKEGRPSSLFVYPRDKNENPVGWRIQLFCVEENIKFDMDFDTEQEAIDAFHNPPGCEMCHGKLHSYKMLVSNDFKCPTCGEKMNPNYWFAKNGS